MDIVQERAANEESRNERSIAEKAEIDVRIDIGLAFCRYLSSRRRLRHYGKKSLH